MSEIPNGWDYQAWYGSLADAVAAKTAVEALPPEVVGAMKPVRGDPPELVDEDGTEAMFAVLTRVNDPLPNPPGMKTARKTLVNRLLSF